jgi:hypothetical protein
MKNTQKLTSALLRKIVKEEMANFGAEEPTEDRAEDSVEVDADELGTDKALDNHIDYVKALKIEEGRLNRRLIKVREARQRTLKKIAANVKK